MIGGGPAGLATAIRARLAGLSARVLERARPPIDKACGEGLMPDAVARLGELGVELARDECWRFRGIRYVDGEVTAEGLFPRAGGRPAAAGWDACGLGVRRLHLHQALARRAAELGVELCWGVAALGLAPAGAAAPAAAATGAAAAGPAAAAAGPGIGSAAGPGSVAAAPPVAGAFTDRPGLEVAAARWVIGADGLRSRVRQWAGLEGPPARRRRFGVRRHFACRPWSDMVEVWWGPRCEAYVTPVGPREVGVAMLWSEGKAGFDELLARFPALAARLAGAPPTSRDRGAGPLAQRARAVCRGNVALVGDASGYVDAITGEGLAVALHQSAALIEALTPRPRPGRRDAAAGVEAAGESEAPGDLDQRAAAAAMARYAAAHRRIGRLPGNMAELMLAIERRPWLRRRVVRALAAEPALFSRLLGIHARTLPPARLGIDGALRLVYRLVTA